MVDRETAELNGRVSVAFEPTDTTGSLHITVEIDGEPVHAATVDAAAQDSHHGNTQRGQFLNSLKDAVADSGFDVKAGVVRALVEGWFDDLQNDDADIDSNYLESRLVGEIKEGTHEPVEIHGASDNNTTFVVTLEFRGDTNEIEFAADDLLPGSSPGPLESALMNQYFERVDIPEEDWEAIADYWHDKSEVQTVTETTAKGARADRVLEYLTDGMKATDEKQHLSNSHRAAYVDADGIETSDGEPAVWVQDRHFVDQIEGVASVDAKQDVCGELRKRGDLKEKSRRHWLDTEGKDRFWAFKPGALGVNVDLYGDSEDSDDAQEGVEV